MNTTHVILKVAKDLKGQESQDLVFNVRPHRAAEKWIQCLKSVQHRAPWKWGYTASTQDLDRITQRIKKTLLDSDLVENYLSEFVHDGDITINQEVVNATHRFVEDHKSQAAWHLQLHNDIHFWEGITKCGFSPDRKIMWNPPGITIPFDTEDYLQFSTEASMNFLIQDFAHVGRDPFNSFIFRDDQKMENSCVIQHEITSGFKWIILDDRVNYVRQEQKFREWVKQHWHFFSTAGLENEYDPRLCFGRMILAEGAEDYSDISKNYKFILKVTVSE